MEMEIDSTTLPRCPVLPEGARQAAPRAAAGPAPPPHLLHIFPSFGIGGVPLRMVRMINHFGERLRHSVLALDGDFAAAGNIAAGLDVALLAAGDKQRGLARRLIGSAAVLRRRRPDLLVTYNWGAIEWAMADRLCPVSRHIHIEAGFGKEEIDRQIRRRVVFRRWALARCARVVVPSRRLEDLALRVWKLPARQVLYVPNGVDLDRFAAPPRGGLAGFARRDGELVVGTVAPLRPEKNVGRLVRVFAALDRPPPARLVVAGDGAERTMLDRLAAELGIGEKVVFTGRVDPETVLGAFDIFALSSDTEQMPNSLLEAMAAGCAVAAVDVGDVKNILSPENREFVVPRDDGPAFAGAIVRLLRDPHKRAELGKKNRERVAALYSQDRMFEAYARIFGIAGTL
jgi:glycosyltransferase involved in cell wall biosynthesis